MIEVFSNLPPVTEPMFESGVTAQWFGTVPAVVLGGIGTLVVIGIWAFLFPELRKAGELTAGPEAAEEEDLERV